MRLFNKSKRIDPVDAAMHNLNVAIGPVAIPQDKLAIVFVDVDVGLAMAGTPDRKPEFADSMDEALCIAADNSDEEYVGIFNSSKKLLLWRFGWERFSYPDDPQKK